MTDHRSDGLKNELVLSGMTAGEYIRALHSRSLSISHTLVGWKVSSASKDYYSTDANYSDHGHSTLTEDVPSY